MSRTTTDYWTECIAQAAEDCGLEMTPEQLGAIATAAEAGHECYGQAFYSPTASDRVSDIQSEYDRKLKSLRAEFDQYRSNAEAAVKKALRVHRDDRVSIGTYGEVLRHDGRTERIQ